MRQIAPIILLLLAILGSIFYTKPTYGAIKLLLADKKEYESALADATELDSRLTDLNTVRNSFSGEDLDRLEKMLPNNIDTVRLIIEINEIAKKYSTDGIRAIVIGSNVQPSSDTNKKTSDNSISLSFAVTAPYGAFLDFLEDIQSNLRIADVTGLKFSTADDKASYNFSVTLKTYWLK